MILSADDLIAWAERALRGCRGCIWALQALAALVAVAMTLWWLGRKTGE